MGDYLRITRETPLDSLNPSLLSAIRAHVEKYELGDIATSALMCCETTSTKHKKGLFGGKAETVLTGVILTPQWLIWATAKDDESPAVLSARLRDIQVQDYEKSGMHKMIPDTGLNVSGLRMDAVDLGSAFIGLGSEPAAEEFRIKLKEALAKA
jgi:hypothetical protein